MISDLELIMSSILISPPHPTALLLIPSNSLVILAYRYVPLPAVGKQKSPFRRRGSLKLNNVDLLVTTKGCLKKS